MAERRRGAVRNEAARLAILEATATLFAERGYDHLSIEGIAAQAGVAKQTVYRWWPGKSALIADCLLEGMLLPVDLRVLPDSGDLRADITTWLDTVVGLLESPSAQGLFRSLLAASSADETVGQRLRDGIAEPALFADRLRAAADSGEIRADLRLDLVPEGLIGPLMFRALNRVPAEPGYAAALVALVLGPRPAPPTS
ncbi:TetR/AcrR family transcriptional regulator [Agromyces seonyuensis]|uniref:TetR family transcriptional regulator n=1 Tax=Agromyces seonyuensis TaxID=2662446 RepID=A0A6I4NRV6_9MICO|nr:TetR/AcrR family transcriptional regulator [Agromyces seonyuensis]MWB97156.1 TetR family transcriptional regulator [Agromyces seonyuensis]